MMEKFIIWLDPNELLDAGLLKDEDDFRKFFFYVKEKEEKAMSIESDVLKQHAQDFYNQKE